MKYIGAHVSISEGVENAPLNASSIGAKAFACFTKNQRQWNAKPFSKESIQAFKERLKGHGFKPQMVLPHDSYLINLGSPEQDKLQKSREAFIDEFSRCEQLGLTMLNFHPGSHLKLTGEEECLDTIAESINLALQATQKVAAVIENTAGQGSNLGYRFEHLAHIIARIDDKSRVGVCLDTCHTYAAGYDIRTPQGYQETMEQFGKIVGFKYLKAMHVNDSLKPLGSKVDRHASIGKGALGIEFFERLMKDDRFDDIPLILETPDEELWPQEIEMLYEFAGK
jgi:deoxyribonuclease-4